MTEQQVTRMAKRRPGRPTPMAKGAARTAAPDGLTPIASRRAQNSKVEALRLVGGIDPEFLGEQVSAPLVHA